MFRETRMAIGIIIIAYTMKSGPVLTQTGPLKVISFNLFP